MKASLHNGFSYILNKLTGQRWFFIISAKGKIAVHIGQFDLFFYRTKTDKSERIQLLPAKWDYNPLNLGFKLITLPFRAGLQNSHSTRAWATFWITQPDSGVFFISAKEKITVHIEQYDLFSLPR